VSRSLVYATGDSHAHTSELARWDQVFSGLTDVDVHLHRSLAALLLAGVRAAVVAPERQLRQWFSWPWYWKDDVVNGLVAAGRLERVDGHVALAE